eukprot:6212207-Pleurochrysis_carterae.AAC.1
MVLHTHSAPAPQVAMKLPDGQYAEPMQQVPGSAVGYECNGSCTQTVLPTIGNWNDRIHESGCYSQSQDPPQGLVTVCSPSTATAETPSQVATAQAIEATMPQPHPLPASQESGLFVSAPLCRQSERSEQKRQCSPDYISSPVSHLRNLTKDMHDDARRIHAAKYLCACTLPAGNGSMSRKLASSSMPSPTR